MSSSKNFNGINYYPNPQKENSYYFFPQHPSPQIDRGGNPMVSITGAGSVYFLQASTLWKANSETIEELTWQLTNDKLIKSPSDITLAPIKVEKAELIININAEEKVLATSNSSGHYPFSAVFNTTISGD